MKSQETVRHSSLKRDATKFCETYQLRIRWICVWNLTVDHKKMNRLVAIRWQIEFAEEDPGMTYQ